MNRLTLLVASLLMSVGAFAQWTKPTLTAQPLEAGAETYLYNLDAEGFLVGANDWGTRASFDAVHGHKVWVQKFESDADDIAWDGQTYHITNYIEQGGMANQVGSMFVDGPEAIYVDRATSFQPSANQGFTFEPQGDNIYKIGLSPLNETYNADLMCYLGAIPEKGDTRLYLCDPASLAYDYAGCQVRWIFVSPAEYATYAPLREQYDAAMALGKALDETRAAYAGIDLSAQEAVYNNTQSTASELQAAKAQLPDVIIAFLTAGATSTQPADFTVKIANPAYDQNTKDGWTGAENASVSFGVSEFYSWDAGWASSTYDCRQTLAALPEGVYRVGVTGYYRSGTNAADADHFQSENAALYQHAALYATTTAGGRTLRALPLQSSGASAAPIGGNTFQSALGYVPNNMETADAYFKAGQYRPTEVLVYVNDGQLTLGLTKSKTENDNWTIWDNWTLHYLGDQAEAYEALAQEALARHTDYKQMMEETENTYCQRTVYDAYVAALTALQTATEKSVITATLPQYETAYTAVEASVKAYAEYFAKVTEAREWISQSTSQSDEIERLIAYTNDNEAEGYNGNGTAAYILENGTLDVDQLATETTYLADLLYQAKANSMADGDDCTNMLQNPLFADAGGWKGVTNANITWPAGLQTYPVMQAHNVACDVYQELTGLQNGLYELNLQGAFRPGDSYAYDYATVTPFAYINGFETKIPSGKKEGEANGLNEADEASTAFAAGEFPVTVYGLVTDGTMRIGLTNKVRTYENCRLWAGGLKLTFRAKNEEVLQTVIANITPEAEAKKTAECGTPETEALAEALTAAQEADGAAALYDGLVALKAAMDAVDAGVVAYQNLSVALFSLEQALLNAGDDADQLTLDKAQAAYDDALAAYQDKSLSTAEAEATIEQLNTFTVAIKMGKSIASEENPVDVSDVIVNNNFDPARGDKATSTIEGWETTSMNGYKQNTVSYNKNTFALSQHLTGLQKGKYKVTVHTYYRAGSYDEEAANINAGRDTHLCKMYAGTEEKPVMNLSEGGIKGELPADLAALNHQTINGTYVPDGTTPSVAWFNAGYYLNELVFNVGDDGQTTIGLHLDETIGTNDYVVVGEWKLWYMGDPTAAQDTVDVSDLIVNRDFDPARGDKATTTIEGWQTTSMNGYKQNTVSYNKNTFALSQRLTGLTPGNYIVKVHTYYRAGSYDEEAANINAGRDTHLCKMYAGTEEKPVMNLSEGGIRGELPADLAALNHQTINGINVPDGTSPSVAWFNAGYYLNELPFTVGEDGTTTIGLHLDETIGTNDYVVVGTWSLYYCGKSQELEANDVSDLIVNNNFDPARGDKATSTIEGWQTTSMNGYKQNTASYNKNTFALSQRLTGLPEGTYKVTVHTYYRAGSYDEEAANINSGRDTHLCKMYAEAEDRYEKAVMNLSEGGIVGELPEELAALNHQTINGITVPDGTAPSVAWFNAGYYLNELPFYVGSQGEATIGLHLDETIGTNDYVVVGTWNLYYYGQGNNVDQLTPVDNITTRRRASTPVTFYSLSGVRLPRPVRGINIVRMSDGTARRVIVK